MLGHASFQPQRKAFFNFKVSRGLSFCHIRVKLPPGATTDQHLSLLGMLNSSTACFWLKQVCQNKGSTVDNRGARQRTEPFEDFYQFNSTNVAKLPSVSI